MQLMVVQKLPVAAVYITDVHKHIKGEVKLSMSILWMYIGGVEL